MKRSLWIVPALLLAAAACRSEEGATPAFINDNEIKAKLLKEAERLLDAGKTVGAAELMARVPAKVAVQLLQPAVASLTPAQIYQRVKPAVLVVGGLYKCDKCTHWHVSAASGFLISPSGVAVTAYHVVAVPGRKTFVAMTSDGIVRPVTAVLAGNEHDDVALIQIDGEGLPALPLRSDAPVGTRVTAVHHPDDQFYVLTEGILSRYSLRHMKDHQQAPGMQVTAEFAKGSSGAPIFDDRGNAIGLVCSTRTIYYNDERKDPQMVMHDCAPAVCVVKLLAAEK